MEGERSGEGEMEKVKIFVGYIGYHKDNYDDLEQKVNDWIAEQPVMEITGRQMSIITERTGTCPEPVNCVIAIFYREIKK